MVELHDETGARVLMREAASLSPFVSGLEYGAPARGPWNIVHIGMLIPESHQVFVCAQGCLRGVVLTAAEMNALDRFSTVSIEEHNMLDGDFEELLIEGVSDVLNGMEKKPRAVLVFTSCIHHFVACDLKLCYAELRRRFPEVDFTDCYMTPTLRKSWISPDAKMRAQLYSLLKPAARDEKSVSIIGNAVSLADSCELMRLLRENGYTVRDICRAHSYDEYQQMATSAVNISTIPTAVEGGRELEARLGQKHLYLPLCYGYDEIDAHLRTLADTLGITMPDTAPLRAAAERALSDAKAAIGSAELALDYTATTRPLGLARLLIEHGFRVSRVYADAFTAEEQADFDWLKANAPELALYATVHEKLCVLPHDAAERADGGLLAIGQKAAYYTGTEHFVNLVEGGGLYGYDGICRLAELMTEAHQNAKDTRSIIQVKGWGCCC